MVGMGAGEAPEFDQCLAEVPEREPEIAAALHGAQPFLDQPRHLVAVDRLRSDVGQRRPLPQRQGRPQHGQFGLGVRGPGRVRHGGAEVHQVQRTGVREDAVPARHGLDGGVEHPVLGEQAAQPQHAGLERGPRGGRLFVAPDHALQVVGRDQGARVEQQGRQQVGGLGRLEDDGLGPVAHAERPEQLETHAHPRSTASSRGRSPWRPFGRGPTLLA